jgi:succinate dehydrogenase / fumarate reductase cytochrome b subunit
MNHPLATYLRSSVGRKQMMGLTGVYLFLFLLVHLVGNLGLLAGAEAFNQYAHLMLHTLAKIIYPVEISLLLAFVVHAALAVSITLENKASRPQRYAVASRKSGRTPWASAMAPTGIFLLFYVIMHVAHFRFGVAAEIGEVVYQGVAIRDLYSHVMVSFSQGWYATIYVVAMIALFPHLAHGVQSCFQTLGINHPAYTPAIKVFSKAYAVVISGGFALLAIWAYLQKGGMA